MDVPFLDIYDAYDLSGDWHFPTDGSYYRGELNEVVFNWFFSNPEVVPVNFAFRGY